MSAEEPALTPKNPDVSDEDLHALFNLAKIGMTKGQWKPAPKYAEAYKRIRAYLLEVGRLPR